VKNSRAQILVLISGFPENTSLSNGVFQQAIKRRKTQQKYQSAMPPLHLLNMLYIIMGLGIMTNSSCTT